MIRSSAQDCSTHANVLEYQFVTNGRAYTITDAEYLANGGGAGTPADPNVMSILDTIVQQTWSFSG
jgi:hypothetical protein